MMMKSPYAWLFLFMGMSLHSSAQHKPLSLKEAYHQAYARYPETQKREAAIAAQEYRHAMLQSDRWPQLQLQAQNSYGSLKPANGAFFAQPGIFNVNAPNTATDAAANFYSYGSVLADWEIFNFGKSRQALKASRYQLKTAETDLEVYSLSLQETVSRLYIHHLYQQQKSKLLSRHAQRLKEIQEVSKALAAAGLTPGADTALVNANYLQLLGDESLWKGKVESSKMLMLNFLGLDHQNWDLPQQLFLQHIPIAQLNPDSSLLHPSLQRLEQEKLQHTHLKLSAASAALPSVSLLGGLSTRTSGHGAEGGNSWTQGFQSATNNYLLGLGLKWNLTGIYKAQQNKLRIAAEIDMLDAEYAKQALKFKTDLMASKAELQAHQIQIAQSREALQQAQEAFRLYQTRYRHGLINLVELLQIQLLLQQAEEKEIEAYAAYWTQSIQYAHLQANFNPLFQIFK